MGVGKLAADVVVIGSGATGLPAAIVAREAGASVILVEAEADIGGHAITSGGNIPLGGGTSVQRKHGIAAIRAVKLQRLNHKDLAPFVRGHFLRGNHIADDAAN